jgi:hypothetical protein
VRWTVEGVDPGEYDLLVRYANHVAEAGETPGDRTMTLSIDGDPVERLAFAPTESWHDWGVHRTSVDVGPATSDVALTTGEDDDGGINLDFVALVPANGEVPAPEPPSAVPPATTTVWFPPGEWVDFFTGERFEGPAERTVEVPIDRMPLYVRAGGVVPMQPPMNHVGERAVDPLTLRAYPGGDGSFDLYEDAGEGVAYRGDQYAWTPVTHAVDDGRRSVTVGPTEGDYPGRLASRGYRVEFVDAPRPETVTVDGAALARTDPDADGEGWWYDGDERAVVVALEGRSTDEAVTVAVA